MMEKISNKERLKLLLQPWVKTEELALILGVSRVTASKRVAEIHRKLMAKGKHPIRGCVSSKELIEQLEIDMDELIANVRIEKELGLYPGEN